MKPRKFINALQDTIREASDGTNELPALIDVLDQKISEIRRDTLTFIGNEVCYFWRVSENLRNSFKGYVNSIELNLSIPFQVGDIVTLDCLPFAPVKRAVIIEITHNYDCCGVRILYRQQREINGNEEWAEGALKHGHGWNRYYPLLSPLYRLSSFTGELPAEEQLMSEVQRYVRQAPDNGIKLEKFVSKSKPDDNELSEYLRNQSLDKCN